MFPTYYENLRGVLSSTISLGEAILPARDNNCPTRPFALICTNNDNVCVTKSPKPPALIRPLMALFESLCCYMLCLFLITHGSRPSLKTLFSPTRRPGRREGLAPNICPKMMSAIIMFRSSFCCGFFIESHYQLKRF